jgi:hypothetical protein
METVIFDHDYETPYPPTGSKQQKKPRVGSTQHFSEKLATTQAGMDSP